MSDDKLKPSEVGRIAAALALGKKQEDFLDTCPNCSFHVELAPRERRALEKDIALLTACLRSAMKQIKNPDRDPEEILVELIGELRDTTRFTDLESKLLTLLDLIETQEDSTLASQRFAIAEEFGYTVVVTGEITSGKIN